MKLWILLSCILYTEPYFLEDYDAVDNPRLVLPARTNSLGHVISNDLKYDLKEMPSNDDRRKRHSKPELPASSEDASTVLEDSIFVVIDDDGEEILLELTLNNRLTTPMTVVEWIYEDGRRVIKKVKENCFYSGKDVKAKGHSLVAVSNCDGLVGYIQTNNESYFIEPLTKELTIKLLNPDRSNNTEDSKANAQKRQEQRERLSSFEDMERSKHKGGPRPHVIYKVNSVLDRLNLSVDQDFKGTNSNQDTKLEDLNFGNLYESVKGLKTRGTRSKRSLESKYLKGGRRTYPQKRDSDDNNNNNNNNNNKTKGGTRKQADDCLNSLSKIQKNVKFQNSDENFDGNFDNFLKEENCLTKRERRERRRKLKEKKKMDREKKKREKEERRKDKKRKKKKTNKDKYSDFKKEYSSLLDPMNEDWEGYSPDLLWETQAAAGHSGLTEYEVDLGPFPNETDPHKWLELTVGIDYSVINFHGDDHVEKYVFTLFNIVSAIYDDPSLQANLDIVLLRLIFYKDKSQGQVQEGLAKRSLESVNRWAETLFRLSAPHSKHDLAVWLTRLDLGGPSGYAPVAGVCDASRSCTLNRDEGLTSAFIIAHEMGHVLGLSHDGDTSSDNTCEQEGRLGSVMAPLVAATFGRFHWSRCSRKEYHISAKSWECLLNDPKKENASVVSSSIQYQYSLDDQCRMEFGQGFGLCRTFGMSDPCTFLWCSNASTPHLCKTKKGPPLEGTTCGDKMWCRQGFCEPVTVADFDSEESTGEEIYGPDLRPPVRHNPQHGGWSQWSSWGPCSKTCGTGIMFQTRECDNPVPRWGGLPCQGKREEWKLCATDPCSNPTDVRADQCTQLPRLVKLGKRRAKLKWLPYESKRRRKKCRVACMSPSTNEVYMGKEYLIDGTPCSYDNPHAVCVQGKCVAVGCDNVIGSRLRYDDCGVCGGSGRSCRRTTFQYRDIPKPGYDEIAVIPKGAWKITVRENPATLNFLSLRDNSSVLVLNPNKRQEPEREFISEGTKFHYVRVGDQESMFALGPLLRPVTIMIHGGLLREEVFITTSFLMREDPRDFFQWEAGPLAPCSVSCGGGKQIETLHCKDLRMNLQVNEKYCDHATKTPLKSYPCNQQSCEVQWVAGEWEHCTATCGQYGVQFRLVSCVQGHSTIRSKSHSSIWPKGTEKSDIFNAKSSSQNNFGNVKNDTSSQFTEDGDEDVDDAEDADDTDDDDGEYEELYYNKLSSIINPNRSATLLVTESETNSNALSSGPSNHVNMASININEEEEEEELEFVDPTQCDEERKPISEKPCNRIQCPAFWRPYGWTDCSVTCGMGQQEVLFICDSENDIEETSSCGKKPREVRACFVGACDEIQREKNKICTKDESAFCRLPTLHRYCKIPKYYELCCQTCFEVLNGYR